MQALVIAAIAPDASGRDRSLLGLELDRDVSRARLTEALIAAGLPPGSVILRRDQGAPVAQALVEVDGFLTDDDPRLAAIGAVLRRPVVLGAYAVPGRRRRRMSAPRPRPEILDISPLCRRRVDGAWRQPGPEAVVQRGRVRRAARRAGGLSRSWPTRLHRYPDGDATELRRAIGARFRLDPARIVCGAGSDDLIYQLVPRLWRPGARHRHERARLHDLPDRRHLRRQPGDQDARSAT